MKAEHEEVLSRLIDGEIVDPLTLTAALAEPDAPRVLADYAAVQAAVQGEADRPRDAFYEKMRGELRAQVRRFPLRGPLAAAALIVLSALGGVWIGTSIVPPRAVPVRIAVQGPVAPVPDVRTLPGPVPAAVVPDCGRPGPPKPNRVVEFVPAAESRPGASAGGNQP